MSTSPPLERREHAAYPHQRQAVFAQLPQVRHRPRGRKRILLPVSGLPARLLGARMDTNVFFLPERAGTRFPSEKIQPFIQAVKQRDPQVGPHDLHRHRRKARTVPTSTRVAPTGGVNA